MNAPVGYIISWRVPTIVELKQLRDGLTAAGLDPDLAPDLKPASRLARTAGFIAKLTSADDAKKLSRPVGHGARQITREEAASADQLTYTREAGLQLAADGYTIECDDPLLAQMVPEASKTVFVTRTASDVTRLVQRIVENSGSDLIPVREKGGAYFVPSGHGIITQVQTLLSHIGGDLSTFACTIGHGSDESIANAITDYLLKQIEELQTSVNDLNEKGVRSDVKSRRLTRVAALRERLGAYATLISTQSAKLTQALDTAEATLLARLGPDQNDETPATAEVAA